MTWNYLQIDLGVGGPDRMQFTCGAGGLVYEAARLDVQEILDDRTGKDVSFRGANRTWRRGAPDDFVMSHGRYVWCLYEEGPHEPTTITAQRLATELATRVRRSMPN